MEKDANVKSYTQISVKKLLDEIEKRLKKITADFQELDLKREKLQGRFDALFNLRSHVKLNPVFYQEKERVTDDGKTN